ncbi:MAG: M48 family metalloprotease, partial [Bdellovibrionales bacterium]|nr:M48 family metalloprotease [Bdellovibrionales bacterium]
MPSTLEEKSQQRIAKAVKDQPQRSDGWTSSLRAPNSISSMAKNRYGKPPDVEPVKKTLEDLKQGIISPFVRESFKLIDQDHPASQHANKLCLKILKRIYPSHDFDKEPVRFLLMDMPDVNACYFKGSEPITICISKNILERLYSDDPKKRMAVDDLAYILGHEYTHFKTFKEFGYTDSCKLQECNCDLDPIEDIVKAGFNRNAGMRVQKLFGESNKRMSALERAFKALVDPHPDPAHRKKMVGGKLAQLRFEKGVFKTNEVSYLKTNPDIQSLISSATYKDWLTEFFEEASYTELGHLAKASVVTEAASIITSSPLCSVYATQLLDTLDEFSKSGTKKSKEVLNLIAEYAIETICTGLKQLDGEDKEQYSSRAEASIDLLGSLYKKCVQGIRFDPNLSRLERAGRFKFGGPLDPIGSLLVLENIIVDLTLADDRDSIRAFAREINLFSWPSLEQRSFEPKLNAARRGFFRSIEMTNFHKPGKDESVSWNAHVIAAIEDIEQQDFTIAKALLKLGVFDQRLVLALPKDMRDKLLNPVEQDRPVSFSSHEDRVDFPDHSEASSQTRSLSPLRRSSEVSSLVVDEVGKVLRREAIRLEESNLPELVDQWIEAMQSKDLSKAPFLDVVRRELSNSWHGTRQEVDCLRKLFREMEKQIYQLNQNIDAERRIFQDLIDFS